MGGWVGGWDVPVLEAVPFADASHHVSPVWRGWVSGWVEGARKEEWMGE